MQDLMTGVDLRLEHQFHDRYEEHCSECFKRGNLVTEMFNKMPNNIIKFNQNNMDKEEKLINRYVSNGIKMMKAYKHYGSPSTAQMKKDEQLWESIKVMLNMDDSNEVLKYLAKKYPQYKDTLTNNNK